MKVFRSNRRKSTLQIAALLFVAACSEDFARQSEPQPAALEFRPEIVIGASKANPAAPFLRVAPDGRLFAVWTEDATGSQSKNPAAHHAGGKMAPSPLRDVLLAASSDGGKAWSQAKRINSVKEAIQSEENGPKMAFTAYSHAYAVWSIPGEKGDKTRANIRFARDDGKGGFSAARTLNEVKDTARFPIIEATPDGSFLIAWIDRRIDNPKPRQLYLMRLGADGKALTKNYPVGEGLCECCKLGIAFADGGKKVYMVDRQVDDKQVRNHVLRKSIDGGASFSQPVQISDDGWQVPSCPHSGPSIGRDSRGWLHVAWFTLGRSEQEAGIYYSVSKDDGATFAPRVLVHANAAPETLYNNLVVGNDDTVYLAWTNIDANSRAQIYVRARAADGRSWSPIQQVSNAKGDASRPVLALLKNQLHVAWTETDGEASRAVIRSARIKP
ncbi:MAG: sialidase family protein [Candidatus Binatia bacterium]